MGYHLRVKSSQSTGSSGGAPFRLFPNANFAFADTKAGLCPCLGRARLGPVLALCAPGSRSCRWAGASGCSVLALSVATLPPLGGQARGARHAPPCCCSGSPVPPRARHCLGAQSCCADPSPAARLSPMVPLQGPVPWLPTPQSRGEDSSQGHQVLLGWSCTKLILCHLHCCHVGERKECWISPFQQGFSAPATGQRDGAPWRVCSPPAVGTSPLHCCSLTPCPPLLSLCPYLSQTAGEGVKTDL